MNRPENHEEEDLILGPELHFLIHGRRHRVDNFLKIIDSWSYIEFKRRLRLPRQITIKLIGELGKSGYIPEYNDEYRYKSAKLCFLLFLWYIANTEPLKTLSNKFDLPTSCIFHILRRVLAWLLTKVNTSITWPRGIDVDVVCEGFKAQQGIPNILGVIDCMQIRIKKPPVDARDYYNRQKFYSISLEAIVDSDLRFTNVYCGSPGFLTDTQVFRKSMLFHIASSQSSIMFPRNTFLIGDSAYPSLPWLVPPFRDSGYLTSQQVEFNYLHSSTRMVIDKTFEQLKGRFRRLKFINDYYNIEFIIHTVIAACVLHNYCVNAFDIYDFSNDDVDFQHGIHDLVQPQLYSQNTEEINQPNRRAVRIDRRTQVFHEIFS
ncbi:hypothetical protein PV328_002095 [Microctonus aethiopoides]|uniref:DDE Tnp4 domain-containing protein n=1 Tax=Microctonus aethiopoides TaxID=144406 RepID=A0AA39FYU1_9HYME|nr:hypothetical protein PV328_002095 [Microctonus aethiopoides]